MTIARPIAFGNWKMHGALAETAARIEAIAADPRAGLAGSIGVFAPFTALTTARAAIDRTAAPVLLGAQDCHEEPNGAFTGDVSAPMLADVGCAWTLVGHSERRHGLGESDERLAAKTRAAQSAGLGVVFCIGETLEERDRGVTEVVLASQIDAGLPNGVDPARLIVAYEPVWAIGTGRSAAIADIEATHRFLRASFSKRIEGGGAIPLLYGGSVKPGNAAEILAAADVDGALIGGASLDPNDFLSIYAAGPRPANGTQA